MKQVDWAETMVLVGLGLVGASVYLWFGWPALVAYVGAVLLIVGGLVAWQQAQRPAPPAEDEEE